MKTIRLNGNETKEITFLQKLLNEQGFPIKETGVFDQNTHEAVCKFQQSNHLDADGIVGFKSWEALLFAGNETNPTLTEKEYEKIALLLDCEVACIKAVQEVETGKYGAFFAPGKPAILFEGHIFWSQLKKYNLDPEQYVKNNENILYPKWDKDHYIGGIKEYERLEKAKNIHEEAALASTSWGMFQIMGFNYASCGEKSIKSFIQAICESECRQLRLFAVFIHKNKLADSLAAKNWEEFARRYNGPGYKENFYHKRLEKAYNKHI